ncbi:unnamed protein product [Arabidopsis thaliana]|uniref:Uncharacterized protein n=1 Tax=Arabidopsis thaliana TaxID=3702 RepID=Q9LHC9_ARATH|nr:unnamed protein product [Arabidopsis thaliana]
MMSYSSQPPSEFPGFSTQMTLGRMTGVDEDIPNNEDSTSTRRKIPKWTTKQNLQCSFDPPYDGVTCRNHFNYVNKILGKWIGAYDNAKCM